MSYAVKEMFLTLQGEGVQAGRRAVFVRFAGCNLWSGREEDRADAACTFCDTDFVGMDGTLGGRYRDAASVAGQAADLWGEGGPTGGKRFVVLTGGEPLLQVDDPLIAALKGEGFEIAVETNGTIAAPAGLDWICVSPKAGNAVVQRSGDELKMVWPQSGLDPAAMEGWAFDHHLVQPLDGPDRDAASDACIAFVLARPRWRLSVQTHKMLGLR
ncbi:7-carboxy-7-deazaguanine synthase [Sphingomonas nostoxanthinifaciens]|uniref:7-carboxy-7-deazaguanine synthase n=1 Tax=Sphingomonas nostoxanthinifaciens TaxID=2872652 RepID=UPI001CC1C2A6|nr:7-carboxy-7-deazaguanine synthase [Sphingomonas nostoxanthinifaciens]UAK22929.1 7-carboxy-7-deazaguanine synthase [Sphingomonas nostoxanthinifaciens]